jgi:hypothetical protein
LHGSGDCQRGRIDDDTVPSVWLAT